MQPKRFYWSVPRSLVSSCCAIGRSETQQGTGASLKIMKIINDHVEIGHLTKYDAFRMNRDQVMDLEI